jgi:dipeptidyl aminopeptidase/acylaminoacyl peptidase
MSFAGAEGHEVPLLYFPPTAPGIEGPPGEAPPLVVGCHGGPTGAAEAGFDLRVQLWTTRGVAVALVDYRGSSGYGRAYRRLLQGAWGVADADDCVAAARFLAGCGLADDTRMAVRGSSAGGLTALRALRAGGPFRAALVSYGVTDLRALAGDTHKFESRYLDGLVGPWPQAADTYVARSPALHPEEIDGAVLLLQGEDDPVVPSDQARRMAAALQARGLRCELELFPGEGHGFRQAETLARAAQLELAFLSSVLCLPTSP